MNPHELVRDWVEAFNRADLAAITALYAEDAIDHQIPNAPVQGRAAIKAMFARQFADASMVCFIENLFEDGDWAILEWRDAAGSRGCVLFQIEGGKIVVQRSYWDRLSVQRAQNLAAPPQTAP